MAEYVEGKARIVVGIPTQVELDQDAITTDNIVPGDLFRFQADNPGYYTVASIVDAQNFTLTAPYTGPKIIGTYYDYLVVRDFTTNHGLAEMSPGDVDIREIFTHNMRKIDEIMFIPSEFPAGTNMLFGNDVAPLGWTRDTSINDRMVRIVAASRVHPGSWVISGITLPDHRHLRHNAGEAEGFFVQEGTTSFVTKHTGLPDPPVAITSDGTWRPLSFDVALCCKTGAIFWLAFSSAFSALCGMVGLC